MSHTRRRVLRVARPTSLGRAGQRSLDRCTAKLTANRASLKRWMAKLKRAFHSVERLQQQIARLERRLNQAGKE